MTRVVVTDQAFGQTEFEAAMAEAAGAEFTSLQLSSEDETAKAVSGAQIVFNNFAPMTRTVMSGLPKDAVVIRYGVGVDNVDLDAAKDLGVRICNVPDYGVSEVADHAAAMAVFLARKVHSFDAAIRQGDWKITQIVEGVRSLSETTVGLIGFGRIAQEFAKRMQAFGCTIVAHDPYVDPDLAHTAGVTLTSAQDVIAKAQILSLHAPLTDQTRHMIGVEELAALPDDAIIINASRGGLIDEEALAKALTSGRIAAAGLDVFEVEPLPHASPLREAPNLFLSPHAAFYSNASVRRLQQLAAEEGARALKGEPLRCPVVGA